MTKTLLLLLAIGCARPYTDPPKSPPGPIVRCENCEPLHPMRKHYALYIDARWSSTCRRWTPRSDAYSDDSETEWVGSDRACQRRAFRASVTCDRPCEVREFRKQAVSPDDARFVVMPKGTGAIRVTVDLHRDDTGETFRWQSDEVYAFGPDDIELVCFDPATVHYESCTRRALDPAKPYFALALRRGDRWIPLRAGLLGRRSAEAVRRDMLQRADEPPAEGGLEAYSLATLLGVDPPPAGEQRIEIEVMSMRIARTLRVAGP